MPSVSETARLIMKNQQNYSKSDCAYLHPLPRRCDDMMIVVMADGAGGGGPAGGPDTMDV
jgi:hypothetical protein